MAGAENKLSWEGTVPLAAVKELGDKYREEGMLEDGGINNKKKVTFSAAEHIVRSTKASRSGLGEEPLNNMCVWFGVL